MDDIIIKDIKFINTRELRLNGESWVKRNSFVTELEHLVNHIHFKIDAYAVHIIGNICFRCGKMFTEQLTSHHSLPKAVKPKYNIFAPLCDPCHVVLNRLYKLDNNRCND